MLFYAQLANSITKALYINNKFTKYVLSSSTSTLALLASDAWRRNCTWCL